MIDWASVKQRLRESESAENQALASDPARLATVCRQRAARLAARKPPTVAAPTIPVLVFGLYPEQYGVELRSVVQVMPFADCTPIPGAPPSLLGVINLRGEIRSVIDLRQILELPPVDDESAGYLILLRHGSSSVVVRVDQVERIRQMAPTELLLPNEELMQLHGRFAAGVTADRLILLSAAAIFSHSVFGSAGGSDVGSQPRDGAVSRPGSPLDRRPLAAESRHGVVEIQRRETSCASTFDPEQF